MKTVRVLVGLLAVACIWAGWSLATSAPGNPPPAAPPQPAVSPAPSDNREKIDALERELQRLKDEQHARDAAANPQS